MNPQLLESLRNPRLYPDKPSNVKMIQTHISFIFLTDHYVYKLKKAVNFGFLDFTTLEKRRFYCEKEIELNRRLAGDVYVGVIGISRKRNHFVLSNESPVEYAVKMKRLPEENMLHRKIKSGVSRKDMEMIGRTLAEFHKEVETSDEIDIYGKIETIKKNTDENFEQTKKYVGEILSYEDYVFSKNVTEEFYKKLNTLIEKRIKEKKIRDGHGDIRMEHICFYKGKVVVFDCIEFVDRFRYGDVLSDMAFLSMELDSEGLYQEREWYENAWFEKMKEKREDVMPLYLFYLSYRAYVRGKVTSFLLDDPHIVSQKKEKIKNKARNLFNLSVKYLRDLKELM